MTKVKEFFKSSAFKAAIVLISIAVISGVLLAILNDVLKVSDEDKIADAIKKIYGKKVGYEEIVLDSKARSNEFGTINKHYSLEDGNFLISATGPGGYNDGTVTLWIVGKEDGSFPLSKVIIAENRDQSLIGNIDDAFLSTYVPGNEVIDNGGYYGEGDDRVPNILSGATYTSGAVNNAVNACLRYLRQRRDNG